MKIRLFLFLLAFGLLAFWLAACGPQPLPDEPTPIPTLIPATMPAAPTSGVQATSNPAQAGMEVFSQHCSACHNTTAETKVGPGLQGLFDLSSLPNGNPFSEGNLRDWIRSGGGAMPGVSLSDQDMDALIEYLRQATHIGGTVVTPVSEPTASLAAQGQEIFQANCAACHNLTTESSVGPGLQGLFDLEALPNGNPFSEDNLRDWIRSGGGAMPGYPLPDDQMDALIAFLKEATHIGGTVVTPVPQPPADTADNTGAEIFNTNCAVCHTLTEQTLVGPGLAGLFDRELPNGEGVNKNNLADWIREGGGAMPGFPLADDQMEALVEYLQDATKQ